jgi:hypothetical protein
VSSIQGILIAGFLVAAIFASTLFRAKLIYRLLALLLFLTASILVIFPGVTTVVAHALGVGRGADLVLYVSLVTGIDIALLLYLRVRDLEQKIAKLAREMAIRDSQSIAAAPAEGLPQKDKAAIRP